MSRKNKDLYGMDFYEEIGHRGKTQVRDMYGVQFYEEIGQKRSQKIRDLITESRQTTQTEKMDAPNSWPSPPPPKKKLPGNPGKNT